MLRLLLRYSLSIYLFFPCFYSPSSRGWRLSLSLSLSLSVFLFLVWKSANFSHQSVAPTSDTAAGHLNTYRIIQQNAIFMLYMLLFSAPCYIHKQVFTDGSPFFLLQKMSTLLCRRWIMWTYDATFCLKLSCRSIFCCVVSRVRYSSLTIHLCIMVPDSIPNVKTDLKLKHIRKFKAFT